MKEHGGKCDEVQFEWGIVGKFPKPLTRQLNEAICIEKKTDDQNLNSKYEYFKQNIRRIDINKEENEVQCEFCSRIFRKVSELEDHEKYVHIRYKCTNCSYLSFGEKDLVEHRNSTHSVCD